MTDDDGALRGAVAFERALLVAAAGWIARAPALHTKMWLCRWVWTAAARIRRQRRVLRIEMRNSAIDAPLAEGPAALIDALVALPSARACVLGIRAAVAPLAASAYGRLAATLDRRGRGLHGAARFYRRVARGGRRRELRRASRADRRALRGLVHERPGLSLFATASRRLRAGTRTASRVTAPCRDASIRALRTGEVRTERWLVSSDEDFQHYLHQMIGFEIAAFEAVGACIADFPHMPWEFQWDMASQIRDELSHLLLWLDRLPHARGRLGQFPVSAFEFDACVGLGVEGRLALLQRLIEGAALEALDLNRALWESRGDATMVSYVNRVQQDEITHVRQGNKWLRRLCGSDAGLAAVVEASERASRARLLDAACALQESNAVGPDNLELVRLRLDQAKVFPINAELRRRAGFSEEEIAAEASRRASLSNES